jgi:hypothetical protein
MRPYHLTLVVLFVSTALLGQKKNSKPEQKEY